MRELEEATTTAGHDFSGLSDEHLIGFFQKNRNDLRFLDLLNDELKRRNSEQANALQIAVIKARRTVLRSQSPDAVSNQSIGPQPVRQWLNTFLMVRRIRQPDGRAFYRYRMADNEYEKVKAILRHLASARRLENPDARAGALFVAYCAEWFRRECDSTFLRWDDPAPDIFPSVPYASKQRLTTSGLKYWQRPLRMSEHAREFLLTLALEGGIPVQILRKGARAWLKDYLRAIMRRAIAWRIDTIDELLAIAKEERGRMRKSYQHDDFIALCSELAERLLHFRRKAEAEGTPAVRNSALLDSKYPGWRDELPIYVPAEDETLVNELLSGLLDERMTGLATEGVEVRRYLVKREGVWYPAVQLLADGEVPSAKLPGLAETSRARAIATGELGNYFSGEVALLEPPSGDQRRWRVRPYMRTAELLRDFPFTAPVTTTVSSPDGVPYPWTWPKGEALRSEVLVFEADEGSTPQEPLLRYLRAGSVSSPAKTLYVLIPHDWIIESATEGSVTDVEDVPALGCKLARLTGAAYFQINEPDSVRFKVEPDSDRREHELMLGPFNARGFVLADDTWELIASPAQPLIHEPRKEPRLPRPGELFVRRPGGKWAPLSGSIIGAGLIELSWRDPIANIQIEKRQLALVPLGASIVGTMKNALNAEVRLEGLSGWTASVRETMCAVEQANDSSLLIRFSGRPVYRLRITLRPPEGQSFDVVVPLVGRDAVIVLANDAILAPGRQIDVGALRGAVAVSPHRMVLSLGAKGSKAGIRTVVDGELPLGILRGAIDETFATLSHQDDLVEIDFIGDSRPPIRICRYRDEPLKRDGAAARWSTPKPHSSVAPVARMVLDPRQEHALERADEDTWILPERCKGPCLIYLRDGADIVSRPIPIVQPGNPEAYVGELTTALAMTEYEERQHAVAAAFARFDQGEAETDEIKWLRDAVTNLNGLPASAFDALKLLPSSPETLIQLLFSARDAGERSVIWALQNELPFLWLAMPVRAWASAMARQHARLMGALENALGKEKALNEAMAWLRGVCSDLAILEPALGTIFSTAGLPNAQTPIVPLRDLISAYIRDQHHRGGDTPNDLGERLISSGLKLPPEIANTSHMHFAGLFAPVLLAGSAQEKIVLDREQALIARQTLREAPFYASGAWPHLLKFYG